MVMEIGRDRGEGKMDMETGEGEGDTRCAMVS